MELRDGVRAALYSPSALEWIAIVAWLLVIVVAFRQGEWNYLVAVSLVILYMLLYAYWRERSLMAEEFVPLGKEVAEQINRARALGRDNILISFEIDETRTDTP